MKLNHRQLKACLCYGILFVIAALVAWPCFRFLPTIIERLRFYHEGQALVLPADLLLAKHFTGLCFYVPLLFAILAFAALVWPAVAQTRFIVLCAVGLAALYSAFIVGALLKYGEFHFACSIKVPKFLEPTAPDRLRHPKRMHRNRCVLFEYHWRGVIDANLNTARIIVAAFGILRPYLVPLPRRARWVQHYRDVSIGGFLFFGAFIAIAWGSILALSFLYHRDRSATASMLLWLPISRSDALLPRPILRCSGNHRAYLYPCVFAAVHCGWWFYRFCIRPKLRRHDPLNILKDCGAKWIGFLTLPPNKNRAPTSFRRSRLMSALFPRGTISP
jgi:hypothetical protein